MGVQMTVMATAVATANMMAMATATETAMAFNPMTLNIDSSIL